MHGDPPARLCSIAALIAVVAIRANALASGAPGAIPTPRATTTVVDPLGRPRIVFRDVRDNIVAVREFNTIGTSTALTTLTTTYAYDRLSQLTDVTDAGGNRMHADYDSLGQMVSLDSLAHVASRGAAPPGVTEDLFDLSGNLAARQTARLRGRGQFIVYDHEFNRLRSIDYPSTTDPLADVRLTYGAAGAPNYAAGRLIRRDDASGFETRGYGRLGEVIRTDRSLDVHIPGTDPSAPHSVVNATTRFHFDSLGRMQSMTYDDGAQLEYRYDRGGRLESAALLRTVIPGLVSDRTPYVNRITYDAFGSRASIALGNGVTTRYHYDTRMRRLTELDTDAPSPAGTTALT